MAGSSLALAFATIERPQVVQRLVRSARRYFPRLPIYVADQSRSVAAITGFYEQHGVTLLRMPYDVGVTASRNRLARTIAEDYFVLCDDDFILGPHTRFDDAARILDSCPEIGVVGGRLYDFGWNEEWLRNWELFLEYDSQQKILFSIPIYELAPRVREVGGIRYFLCDAVLNFAVFRRSMFADGVAWDEQFKSNGEHEDFFLNLKVNSLYRVAYLPTMVAHHHHPEEYRAYVSRLRDRNEGWRRLFKKWGLEQHIEYGLGVRTLDDLGAVVDGAEARSRFFLNAELSLRRKEAAPNVVLIGDFERIDGAGSLDEKGNSTTDRAAMGRLLLDRRSAAIVAAPEAMLDPAPVGRPPAGRAEEDRFALYGLEGSPGAAAVSSADRDIYFRYDAILHRDADFYLWYFCGGAAASRAPASRRLAAIVRWFDGDGRPLVWRSRRRFLDLNTNGCWQPLHIDVPLLPRNAAWLRFELVTDGGKSPDPLCTGCLFRPTASGRLETQAANCEVLGLSRLPNDGATPGSGGRFLDEIGRECGERRVHLAAPSAAAMRLLDMNEIPGLDALFFVGWERLGRGLIGARLPQQVPDPPTAMALPLAGRGSAAGQIYGFGHGIGFVRLVAAENAVSPMR